MADGATMRPATPAQPAVTLAYDADAAYDYPVIGYDALTYTPGAATMTPA